MPESPRLESDIDYDDIFSSLALPKTFNLELAQELVAAGLVNSLDEIYQVPLPGELEAYEKRRTELLKKDAEFRRMNECVCDIDTP
ncbi:MAG TPA: hypothetical protein VLE44_02285 [Candidatus Saccharimonadales bacterium]|nr:hypothetical protein [Candidatus Saccharimonadales bacterium]